LVQTYPNISQVLLLAGHLMTGEDAHLALAMSAVAVGAFNPAVAIGVSLLKLSSWSNIWIFLVGCFGGGALAAVVFRINNADDK
jgi:hypothetical protein